MVRRVLDFPKEHSFFLFGARGTGKSTLLKSTSFLNSALYIDLLNLEEEEKYTLHKNLLLEQAQTLKKGQWIVIDEVQKIPKLLDLVHKIIEEKKIYFALSGSSARKLKRGGANLLAGRAFVFSLFPLTYLECKKDFKLSSALQWGTLPYIRLAENEEYKERYLRSYAHTYLKEEIQVEQLVRNLTPFRLFLRIAAQTNGEIINYSNIAKDTGVDHKTVESYYEILQDTHLGFFLYPYARSVRKVQIQSPKFYLFDLGVKRSLENRLKIPIQPGTSEYGKDFESFFINECIRLNAYFELDYQFSYLCTKDGAEIDLIIERPDKSIALVEIKSTDRVDARHLKWLESFKKDFPKAEFFCVSCVTQPQRIGKIQILPWQESFHALGLEK